MGPTNESSGRVRNIFDVENGFMDMYLKKEEIRKMERRYGRPKELEFDEFEMQEDEFWLLEKSMENGRAHDVTAFIFIDNQIVVIQKHLHPPGVFRAPSGSVKPGENMEDGIKREIYEETGLKIRIERYVLRIKPVFTHSGEKKKWTSHIFLASKVGGELRPIDEEEIKKVRLATIRELQSEIRKRMIESYHGGLIYRAKLTDAFLEEVGRAPNVLSKNSSEKPQKRYKRLLTISPSFPAERP